MSWWKKLKEGIQKSSSSISNSFKAIIGREVDAKLFDEIEELLITHDFGVETSRYLREAVEPKFKSGDQVALDDIKKAISAEVEAIFESCTPVHIEKNTHTTQVLLFIGVNGSGKTTMISKLTKQLLDRGYSVEWAACDTFRSAAVEQLQVWADRLGIHVYTTKPNGDAAGLAFDALTQAKQKNTNFLIIDTAGRLQNKDNLMQELEKVKRVLKKVDDCAPHYNFLVLDATTGQNAYSQVDAFGKVSALSGLIMNKLDGTAKGGVLVGLSNQYKLPIIALGIGEKAEDFLWFNAKDFAQSLLNINNEEND